MEGVQEQRRGEGGAEGVGGEGGGGEGEKKRLVCRLPRGVWQHCLRAIEVPSILLIAFCGFPGSEVWPFKVKLSS